MLSIEEINRLEQENKELTRENKNRNELIEWPTKYFIN